MSIEIPEVLPRDLASDPHHYFALHRSQSPFIRIDQNRVICIRAKDVFALLTDPRLPQTDRGNIEEITGDMPSFTKFAANSALYSNGQVHKERRKVWSTGFSPKATLSYKEHVEEAVATTCDKFAQNAGLSFIYDLCQEIPERVISDILGIRLSYMREIRELAVNVGAGIPLLFDTRDGARIDKACHELELSVSTLVQKDICGEVGQVLKNVSAVQASGRRNDEYIANVMLLLVAGVNTTRNALSTIFLFLMQNADIWRQVKDQPSSIEGILSESLRFDPAVGAVPRVASENIEISGFNISKGTHVILSLSSALQDPEMFDNPSKFRPLRSNIRQADLRFGKGFHRCIGQPLARKMIEETIIHISKNYPDTCLSETRFDYTMFGGLRRIDHLPIAVQ